MLGFILYCCSYIVLAEAVIAQYSMSYYNPYVSGQIVNSIKNNDVTHVDLTYTGGMIFLANEIKQAIGQSSDTNVELINIGQSASMNAVIVSIFGTVNNINTSAPKSNRSFYDYTTPNVGFYSK
jgi:hypothetical protein